MTETSTLTTTGLRPLMVGSVYTFEWSANRNGLPWNIAGGTATLSISDPSGNVTTVAGVIDTTGYAASASWVATLPAGMWSLQWRIQDAGMVLAGTYNYSEPLDFSVAGFP